MYVFTVYYLVFSSSAESKILRPEGFPEFRQSLFGKIWPWYVKFVCPVLVTAVIWASFG